MKRITRSASASIIGLALIAVPLAGVAHATTLTFDSLSASLGGGVPVASPFVESGYQLSVLGVSGFYAFADGWQSNRGSTNGTTTLGVLNFSSPSAGFSVQAVDASAFSLGSIDVGEVFHPNDFAFAAVSRSVTFTGHLSGGGTLSSTFVLDLLSNGPAPPADFQTVTFSSSWTGLTSVDVVGSTLPNTFGAYVNIDNIVVAAVPEPSSLLLLSAGLIVLRRRTRKTPPGQ